MKISSTKIFAICLAMTGSLPALAQSNKDSQDLNVIGNVPNLCSGGTLTGGGTFNLGVLIDTSTALLRTDIAAPTQTLVGSFCSTRSTINVTATPLLAQNFTVTPPDGFSRRVDYSASATGWTDNPATFSTAAATNAASSQTRSSPYSSQIAISLSGYTTNGGNRQRLVADTSYLGLVTVTITAAD
jgi:hypothetical protein